MPHRFDYPVFLDLERRPCLVVGGGAVALRKAKDLLAAGAKVRVVSPRLAAGFQPLVRTGRVVWVRRVFRPTDLKVGGLVVAATDEERVNRQAAREARRRGSWINVVDQPARCSFIVPSVVRRGELRLAISTGGASPALARWIRTDLERRYGPDIQRFLKAAMRVRPQVQAKVPGPALRKRLFEKALKAYFEALNIRPSTRRPP